MKKIRRILLLPLGFLMKVMELANNGARDYENKIRFKHAIIDKKCSINSESVISHNVHVLENCVINNSKINSYTYVGKNCIIQNATIGKFCSIANDVLIGLGKHPVDNFSTATLFYRKKNTLKISLIDADLNFSEYENITIGNDVWIGSRALIMDGVTIGNGAIIAANAIVTKDIPSYAIVGGIPAKVIKFRFGVEKIQRFISSNWWDLELEEIKMKISILNEN